MSTAREWLLLQLARKSRPTLDIALLTNRGGRYAVSRVGLVGMRALVRTALHFAELYLLSGEFPFQLLVPLLAMRSLPGLLSGVHWGALEELRQRVRHAITCQQPERARVTTEAWLALAGLTGLGLLAIVYSFVARQTAMETEVLGLYGSFSIVCTFALAVDLWTRTYHAGVFATGRIYRPAWSIFAPDFLDLTVLFLLWPRIGPFALHCVVLIGTVVRGALATYYAARAYRARRLSRPGFFRLTALRRLGRTQLYQAGKQAFATLPFHVDRALLLTLLGAPSAGAGIPIAAPYYALRPILAFAHAWPRVFYADLVRLDVAALGMLRRRFERLLQRTAIAAGLSAAGLVALLAFVGMGKEGLLAAVWLMPLSIVRSQFALKQLLAFVYGAHLHLILVSTLLLLGLVAAPLAQWSDRTAVIGLTVLLALALGIAGRVRNRAADRRNEYKRRLPMAAFLADVCAYQSPIRLTIALVDQQVAGPGAVIAELARHIESGHMARCGRNWLLWWEPEATAKSRTELARRLAGAVVQLDMLQGANGLSTLQEALAKSILPPQLTSVLNRPKLMDTRAELKLLADAMVPSALRIDLSEAGATTQQLAPRQLILARRAALASAREQHIVPRWAPWQATTYAPGGEIEVIYLWPKDATGARRLRELAQATSWRDSLPEVDH